MSRTLIQWKRGLQSIPAWQLYLIFVLCYFVLLYCIEELIYFDPKHFTGGNDNSVITYRNVFKFIYAALPLVLLLKFKFFQALIRLSMPQKMRSGKLIGAFFFKLLISGSFILLLPWLVKVIWFKLFNTDYTMEEAANFEFLSLYHLLQPYLTSEAFDYILKLINPFEVFFIVYMSWGLTVITKQNLLKNLRYIFIGYALPILLYSALKIFINVYFLKL